MENKFSLIVIGLLAVIIFVGCGVPTADYELLVDTLGSVASEKEQLETKNTELLEENTKLLEGKVKYFKNRVEIENWLNSVQKPTEDSRDVEEWFVYALSYQKKALDAGFIISVSWNYVDGGDSIIVSCDIWTVDGTIYWFDPDDAILEDTGLRIPLEDYKLDSVPIRYPTLYESY